MEISQALAKKLGVDEKDLTPELLDKYSFISSDTLKKDQSFSVVDTGKSGEIQVEVFNKKELETKVQDLKSTNEDLESKVENLKSEKKTLEDFKKDNQEHAEFGKTKLKEMQDFAVSLYKKSLDSDDDVKETLLSKIQDSKGDDLTAYIEQYGGACTVKYGAKVDEKTGKVVFKSSQSDTLDDDTVEFDDESLAEQFRG